MAQKVIIHLIDDLDGSDATQTVQFGYEGVEYTIDLSDANAANLRTILTEHAQVARRTSGRRKTSSNNPVPKNSDAAQMREWLRSAGHEISDRGRIPNDLVKLYQERPGQGGNQVIDQDDMKAISEGIEQADEGTSVKTTARKTAAKKPTTATKTTPEGGSTRKAAPKAEKPSQGSNVVEFSAASADKAKPVRRRTTTTRTKSTAK